MRPKSSDNGAKRNGPMPNPSWSNRVINIARLHNEYSETLPQTVPSQEYLLLYYVF